MRGNANEIATLSREALEVFSRMEDNRVKLESLKESIRIMMENFIRESDEAILPFRMGITGLGVLSITRDPKTRTLRIGFVTDRFGRVGDQV